MIADKDTNTLFLADTLQTKYHCFFENFKSALSNCGIKINILQNTKDVWAVDYMPVQIKQNKFVQFTYFPSYLRTPKYQKTISDVDSICKTINIVPEKSAIILDGGNVIRATDKVIITDRVFKENPHISEKVLINRLQETLEVDKIIFIPSDPNDFTGHADGMVRFIDDDTVLINNYSISEENPRFLSSFRLALHNGGLKSIEVPYNPYGNKNTDQAVGTYLNYLQMEKILFVPIFGMKEDDKVVRLYESIFSDYKIVTLDSKSVAEQGGILNCITWNIKT